MCLQLSSSDSEVNNWCSCSGEDGKEKKKRHDGEE